MIPQSSAEDLEFRPMASEIFETVLSNALLGGETPDPHLLANYRVQFDKSLQILEEAKKYLGWLRSQVEDESKADFGSDLLQFAKERTGRHVEDITFLDNQNFEGLAQTQRAKMNAQLALSVAVRDNTGH
jgi:hypothetical protein